MICFGEFTAIKLTLVMFKIYVDEVDHKIMLQLLLLGFFQLFPNADIQGVILYLLYVIMASILFFIRKYQMSLLNQLETDLDECKNKA